MNHTTRDGGVIDETSNEPPLTDRAGTRLVVLGSDNLNLEIDMNETPRQFVERIWGKPVTGEQIEGLLWHCTAFPCISVEMLEEQLMKVKEESGGDYDRAMAQAEAQINEAMKGA